MKLIWQPLYLRLLWCQSGVIAGLLGAYFESLGLTIILFALLFIVNHMIVATVTRQKDTILLMGGLWFCVGLLWGCHLDGVFSTLFIGIIAALVLGIGSGYLNLFIMRQDKL